MSYASVESSKKKPVYRYRDGCSQEEPFRSKWGRSVQMCDSARMVRRRALAVLVSPEHRVYRRSVIEEQLHHLEVFLCAARQSGCRL
jgi:hypothetical protein